MKFQEYLARVFLRSRDRELWLRSPNPDLENMTPNECIKAGEEERVLEALKRQLHNVAETT